MPAPCREATPGVRVPQPLSQRPRALPRPPHKHTVQSQPHLPLHLSHPFHNHNPLHNSHPPLIRYPYNAEARLRHLTDTWITPVGKHFVRNHCSVNAPLNNAFSLSKPPPSPLPPQVPDIDPETYRLTVAGVGLNTTTFTLSDLKTKFPRVEIASVIQVGVLGLGFRVLGFGFWVLGFGFWVLGFCSCLPVPPTLMCPSHTVSFWLTCCHVL